MKNWMAGALLALLYVAATTADVIYLSDGRQLSGRLARYEGTLYLETIDGSLPIQQDSIQHIQRQRASAGEFAGRLVQMRDDPDACVKLAGWAFDNYLDREAVLALRAALLANRKHSGASQRLYQYQKRADRLPINETDSEKLLADFGPEFQILRTEHYRICYNCSKWFAQYVADLMEQLYDEFITFFDERYFVPAPITDRLEIVLFDTPEQFRRHAVRVIGPGAQHSAGFYAPGTHRSYFYDAVNSAAHGRNVTMLKNAQADIEKWKRQVRQEHRHGQEYIMTDADGEEKKLNRVEMLRELRKREKELEDRRQELSQSYDDMNLSVAIHEGTHHLAFASGIHSRFYATPTWILEGLATYFEAPTRGRWLGPGQINPNRLESFTEELEENGAVRLDTVLTNEQWFNLAAGDGKRAYAATWSLFYYLVRKHHEDLFDYIYDLSMRISNEPYTDTLRRKDFAEYFGSLEILERDWYRYMLRLE